VAARIRLSEGSIGYVEYWFAQRLGLRMAALANKAGNFITPTAHAGELALSGRVAQVQELAASVADPSGPDAYPLVSYSWMLVYAQYADQAKARCCGSLLAGACPNADRTTALSSGICHFRLMYSASAGKHS
jgi:phosphate transport system substrate-binding protein